jgi:hypothetical protein
MGKHNRSPIPSFPPDIDRQRFGDWLSGFVDGEGCFVLTTRKRMPYSQPSPTVRLAISLRADDRPVLDLIRSYLGCGCIGIADRPHAGNDKPAAQFRVNSIVDLAQIIVPHFDLHPLFAKKKRDFAIWRQAVLLCKQVHDRISTVRNNCKWTLAELAEFKSLFVLLRSQRQYQAPALPMPPPKLNPPTRGLFD